jgi:membrane protein
VYGAAGSLLVLLVWVYYSAQIFLIGVEYTKAYALKRGAHLSPKSGAEMIGASAEPETVHPIVDVKRAG